MAIMLTFHGVTHPGRVRKINEDGFCHDARLGLFLVADGLGGHNAGEIASRMALESVSHLHPAHLRRRGVHLALRGRYLPLVRREPLRTALRLANRRVFQASEEGVEYAGMGTTIVAALVVGQYAHLSPRSATAGSIRSWTAPLSRLTVDDSWLATLSAQDPDLDPAQLERSPAASRHHQGDRHAGRNRARHPRAHAQPGETLLLCSDGLHDMVTDEDISAEVSSRAAEPRRRGAGLVDGRSTPGGRDNVTALLVRYERVSTAPRATPSARFLCERLKGSADRRSEITRASLASRLHPAACRAGRPASLRRA